LPIIKIWSKILLSLKQFIPSNKSIKISWCATRFILVLSHSDLFKLNQSKKWSRWKNNLFFFKIFLVKSTPLWYQVSPYSHCGMNSLKQCSLQQRPRLWPWLAATVRSKKPKTFMTVICQWRESAPRWFLLYKVMNINIFEGNFFLTQSINPYFKKLSPERHKPIKTDLWTAYLRQTYLEPHSSLNCSFIEVLPYGALIKNSLTVPFLHWRRWKIPQLSVWGHPIYLLRTQAKHHFSQLSKTRHGKNPRPL